NPMPDRQSRDLNRVFFTASHVMVAMGIGYGMTIIGAYLVAQFERFREYCLYGALGAAAVALLMVATTYQPETGFMQVSTLVADLEPTHSPLVRFTQVFSLLFAVAGVAIFFLYKKALPRLALL